MKKEAKRIISRMNSGKEVNYKGLDYLFYGMGLYGYSEDVKQSGVKFATGANSTFLHIVPEVENVAQYLNFIQSSIITL